MTKVFVPPPTKKSNDQGVVLLTSMIFEKGEMLRVLVLLSYR